LEVSATQPGALLNEAGATLTVSGGADLQRNGSNPENRLENRGTLVKNGTAETAINGVRLNNDGIIEVRNGALTVSQGGIDMAFNGSNYLRTQPGTTLRIADSITGTTTNADLFSPRGVTIFTGGTAAAPRLLEVMGRDFGVAATGFDQNLAFGALVVDSGSYVQLTNDADNVPGNEALYVDTLVVRQGSTLNLNLRQVYARIVQIDGMVIGGTINSMPDGGLIAFDSSASGSISESGQVDEWSFFGRAGQAITLFVDPGRNGSVQPAAPYLDEVAVEVLTPTGEVLSSAVSTGPSQAVSILGVELPDAGTYRIRVRSAPSQATARGNYYLSLYNATVDVSPLVFNQRETGVIETPYSADRRTFNANANQQVRLDVVNSATPAIRFQLAGPNGWIGFSGLSDDSDLITLPTTGVYTLEVLTGGNGSGGYAFKLDEISQTELPLDQSYSGTLPGNGSAQLFRVEVPQGNPLAVIFDGVEGVNAEVYLRLGTPPTRRHFDQRNESSGAEHLVLMPFASPGAWYVLVYGEAVSQASAFSIRATSSSVIATASTPDMYGADQTVTLTVFGAGFLPGTRVELVSGSTTLTATATEVNSTGRLTATVNLNGAAQGLYDVRIVRTDGAEDTLPEAFTVVPFGVGVLETDLILPSVLGRHATATLYIEYANTGNAAIPAPILTLQSADRDGSDRPILTLDRAQQRNDFWASSLPEGSVNSVQIYASGKTSGVLQPGERIRVPVYYSGLLQPWNFGDNAVEFELLIRDADDTVTVDW